MFNKTIRFNQQFPQFLRIMGILLLFVLTSCPIKASIKHNLYEIGNTENRSNKVAKGDFQYARETIDCNAVDQQITSQDFEVKEFQFQPAILSLISLTLILFNFLQRKDEKQVDRIPPGYSCNNLFLQFSRLNL